MDLLQGLTASILVFLVLAATIAFLRSRGLARFDIGRKPASRMLETVERLSLSPQHALHLVRIGDKLVVVASAPGGCNIFGPLDDNVKVAR
ncbi:MAG: flagellar biosynthetic protein FliO [Bryobacteraceae bacterium]|nr:flagellar biosynthetic protein FliO [Bryobacteraceae bacterium]